MTTTNMGQHGHKNILRVDEEVNVKLECVYEFAYLGDMLNDTGGVEQAVAARVRATWMKFSELGGILCM